MDKFLPYDNELGALIEASAVDLYQRLQQIEVDKLGLPEYCLAYFKSSHSKRLFFSIETSAHLLYRATIMVNRRPSELIIMDYGAGVGTLYLLAKIAGFKQVIYNDHLEDWKLSAQLIAEAIDVHIDHYIVGDIEDCLDRLEKFRLQCHIITSRNVIEHIYKLDQFYKAVHDRQPEAIVFSSTTANKKNPASVIKHRLWHHKWEKVFRGKRMVAIERQAHGLSATKMHSLARATKGLAADDLKEAIEEYRKTRKLPDPRRHRSNTCDPANGVWAEHLLSVDDYRQLINENRFTVSFAPGFWDTHYPKEYMNKVGRTLNKIIVRGGKKAMMLAPFMYVIAKPVQRK